MAIYLSNGVVVTLNSVDLSDHVTSATINRSFDELEVTAMGDTAHQVCKRPRGQHYYSRLSKRYCYKPSTTDFAGCLGYNSSPNA
jgi:hypothetical protein